MLVALLFVGFTLAGTAIASDPSDHAPIGVMGDHTHGGAAGHHAHKGGATMLSYRYMRMGMDGLRDGTSRVSRGDVLEDFMVTPLRMDMEMHMFGVMHAPIEGLTLMLMVPYVFLEMDHQTRGGARFTTRSHGLGDISATALIDLLARDNHKIHAHVGLSFPSGSISKKDTNPMSAPGAVRLPYPMQLGSGSFDFLPGLTYTGHLKQISWGAQGLGEIRLNENSAGYRLGNEYSLTAWSAVGVAKWLSMSFRMEWREILNIRGRDGNRNINPAVVPTADPNRRASQRLDVLFGVNFIMPDGPLSGVRFGVEAGFPVHQNLDGPGLETDYTMTVGVQYAY